jgi:hypothetical protein
MSESSTLVIGDVHQNVAAVLKAVQNWKGRIIFVGDYFDDFDDSPMEAYLTAEWLKDSLKHENRIHLCGNHDFHYMCNKFDYVCSGFSEAKYNEINRIMTREDWNKIKFFFDENDFWFSHAGVTRYWFEHPIKGINAEIIKEKINKAQQHILVPKSVKDTETDCLWASDYQRGGTHKFGGILWSHYSNCEFYEGITQVFGHTYCKNIEVNSAGNARCINVDTYLNEVLEITEKGEFLVHQI